MREIQIILKNRCWYCNFTGQHKPHLQTLHVLVLCHEKIKKNREMARADSVNELEWLTHTYGAHGQLGIWVPLFSSCKYAYSFSSLTRATQEYKDFTSDDWTDPHLMHLSDPTCQGSRRRKHWFQLFLLFLLLFVWVLSQLPNESHMES